MKGFYQFIILHTRILHNLKIHFPRFSSPLGKIKGAIMIEKNTLQFLTDLKKNNTKEWFDANRKRYESAKEDVQNITGALIKAIGLYDEDIAQLQVK